MKKTALLSTFGLCALAAQAVQLSPDEALQRALGDAPMRVSGQGVNEFRLMDTRSYEGRDAVYLFGRGDKGFVVAAADDAVPALLGYGESVMPADAAELAPGFAYWLDFMARRVAYAARYEGGCTMAAARPERQPIEPLCSTTWNQSEPYNLCCPEVNGRLSVTGCVATAMAQAMKYHDWPASGVGSHSYSWGGTTLSIDFAACDFRWDLMADHYHYSGTATESDLAVAELMKAAGYSVDMSYSPSASGAISMNIAPALGQYFRYDRSLRYLQRDYYSLRDWEELIYSSLAEYGPVIYDGQSYDGGHSFICDGYDKDGYFHFNWGWNGMSDGYFLLDALDPIHQGIGGASAGFNFMQDAITGIRPDRTGDSQWHSVLVSDSDFSLSYDETVGELTMNNMVYNSGPGPVEAGRGRIGLRLQRLDVDGNATGEPEYIAYTMEETLPVRYGYRGLGFDITDLADGSYLLDCVYSIGDGAWEHARSTIYQVNYCHLVKDASGVTLTPEKPALPELHDGVFQSELYLNDNIVITGTLVNAGDQPYYGVVSAVLLSNDLNKVMGVGESVVVDLEPEESKAFTYDESWSRSNNYRRGFLYVALAVETDAGYILLCEPQQIKCYDRVNGIGEVSADAEVESVGLAREYYAASGAKVAQVRPGEPRPSLPAGVYIVRSAAGASKIVVR